MVGGGAEEPDVPPVAGAAWIVFCCLRFIILRTRRAITSKTARPATPPKTPPMITGLEGPGGGTPAAAVVLVVAGELDVVVAGLPALAP